MYDREDAFGTTSSLKTVLTLAININVPPIEHVVRRDDGRAGVPQVERVLLTHNMTDLLALQDIYEERETHTQRESEVRWTRGARDETSRSFLSDRFYIHDEHLHSL